MMLLAMDAAVVRFRRLVAEHVAAEAVAGDAAEATFQRANSKVSDDQRLSHS